MPKTAGAVRRKVKTPAEERTKLTQNFVNLSVCGRRGFFPKSDIKCCGFTMLAAASRRDPPGEQLRKIKQEVNHSWQKLN